MEDSVIKEWSPFTNCLHDIPLRVRRGIFLRDVEFLCIDVVEEFIAIGTNIGIVYWCNRLTNQTARLRPQNTESKIVAVKAISTVEFMVAAADCFGSISIFVIPKEIPSSVIQFRKVNLQQLPKVELYTPPKTHNKIITALEWSSNGEKLFTGDEDGLVTYTQIDFQMHFVRCTELLNEKYSIIQLSYHKPQLLLISTEYRCIICYQLDGSKILQIDHKKRSSLCKVSAIFGHTSSSVEPVIFSTRSKQRIRIANKDGITKKMLSFKDVLSKKHNVVKLLPPHAHVSDDFEMEFTYLRVYKENMLLVYCDFGFVLLNYVNMTVDCALYYETKILSIATNKDEIFFLEGSRKIRRLAHKPDSYVAKDLVENLHSPISNTLSNIVAKFKKSANIRLDRTTDDSDTSKDINYKEEDMPFILPNSDINDESGKNSGDPLNKIGQETFDDVVFNTRKCSISSFQKEDN